MVLKRLLSCLQQSRDRLPRIGNSAHATRTPHTYRRASWQPLLVSQVNFKPSFDCIYSQTRHLSVSAPFSTPEPIRSATSAGSKANEPANLTTEDYHERADEYLENLLGHLEDIAESKLDIDVEYSAGVLTCVFPPNGTYVLNKQPPNKQIWLSSPISGPKRYDYVLDADAVDTTRHIEGEEGKGNWVYLRDGTRLSDILKKELGVSMED